MGSNGFDQLLGDVGGRTCRQGLANADVGLTITPIGFDFSILVLLLVTLRVTYMPDADVGTIFAIFVYVWRLMEKLDMMPQMVQQLMRLKDIRRLDRGRGLDRGDGCP